MQWQKPIFVTPLLLIATGCSGSAQRRDRSLLHTLSGENVRLQQELARLKERVVLLESRQQPPHRVGRESDSSAELGPKELPIVTLKPTKGAAPRPPQGAPVPAQKPRRPGGRRVVIRLRGTPPPQRVALQEHTPNGGKVLRLGRFYPLKEPSASTVSLERASTPKGRGARPEEIYRSAMRFFREGRYAHALVWLTKLLKRHPGSSYMDNALFWKGECYYNLKKYAMAIPLYTRVIQRYGTENKAPDALFKLAMSYLKMGRKALGRQSLARVMELYPNSQVAVKAARVLERMR